MIAIIYTRSRGAADLCAERIDQTFQRRGRLLWRRIRQRENEKSEKEDARRSGGRTAHDPHLRHALPELCPTA